MKHARVGVIAAAMLAVVFSRVSEGEPGARYNLSPNNLPAPRTTLPNDIDPRNETPPRGFLPTVPPGFSVSVFVSTPEIRVRWLRVAPNGDVFLADRDSGRITVLRDADGNGKAERVATFATGFSDPHGMAFHAGGLYVADVRAIWRLPYADGDLAAKSLPTRKEHRQAFYPRLSGECPRALPSRKTAASSLGTSKTVRCGASPTLESDRFTSRSGLLPHR